MKRAGVKMDLENDSATIFGKDIALNLTTSGHYCIPIDRTENIAVEEVFSVKLEEMGRQDKVKTLLKLHRQFAHPRPRKLKSLLQDADIWRDDYQDLFEEIDRKCELCKRYSKTPARPVVVMSTIVVIKLSVTSRKYFLVFNNGSRVDPHGSIWIREGLHIQRFVKVFLWN